MKTFTGIIIILVLWSGIMPLARELPAQDRYTDGLDAEGYLALKKDIEIMRRVLEKALTKHVEVFQNAAMRIDPYRDLEERLEKKSDRLWPALTYSGMFAGAFDPYLYSAKGFFVPGSGAVFSLDVVVPARAETLKEDEEGDPDLWQEAEEELRLGHTLKSGKKEEMKRWVIDPKAVDGIIDMLINTVAHHGGKIEHLGGGDSITLIVHFKGHSQLGRVSAFTGDTALALSSIYLQVGKDPLAEDAIIQVPVSALDHHDKTGDVDHVKNATKIHRFIDQETKGGTKSTRRKSF